MKEKGNMLRAIENAEQFQTRNFEPMNGVRSREGLPNVTREEVQQGRQEKLNDFWSGVYNEAKERDMTMWQVVFDRQKPSRRFAPSKRWEELKK